MRTENNSAEIRCILCKKINRTELTWVSMVNFCFEEGQRVCAKYTRHSENFNNKTQMQMDSVSTE